MRWVLEPRGQGEVTNILHMTLCQHPKLWLHTQHVYRKPPLGPGNDASSCMCLTKITSCAAFSLYIHSSWQIQQRKGSTLGLFFTTPLNPEKLECVQKFGLKVCLKQWHSTYEDLTVQAGIPSLAVRRKLLKLCQLYSILNGHVNFHNFPTVSRSSLFVNRIRSVHSSSLSLPFAHSNFYNNSFFRLPLICGTVCLEIFAHVTP